MMLVKLTPQGLEYLERFCKHTAEDLSKELEAKPYPEYDNILKRVSGFECALKWHALQNSFYTVIEEDVSTLPSD